MYAQQHSFPVVAWGLWASFDAMISSALLSSGHPEKSTGLGVAWGFGGGQTQPLSSVWSGLPQTEQGLSDSLGGFGVAWGEGQVAERPVDGGWRHIGRRSSCIRRADILLDSF